MAAQSSFSLHEEELSCPICFEDFNLYEKNRHPKLLLCLHTFCLACMETLRKYDGTLQCSICRTSHHVYRVNELMDNYVIFEHLRIKQEYDDEKLAVQLKEEYDISMRLMREQEERDEVLAREEEEKNRLEEERRRQEEQRIKQEEERLRIEEEKRLQREEEQNLARLAEEERIRNDIQQREREELERNRANEEYIELSSGSSFEDENLPEIWSSSDSNDTRSENSIESNNEDLENDEEVEEDNEPFQDPQGEESDDATSVVDQDDDYETFSSDTDQCSVDVLSSDEEDEMGTALSTTTPPPPENHSTSTSPEPDLLSEEFSGVSQPNDNASKPNNAFAKLLPSVKCTESADGRIIIINDSLEESPVQRKEPLYSDSFVVLDAEVNNTSSDETEEDRGSSYSSDDERNHFSLPGNSAKQRTGSREEKNGGIVVNQENDENCKVQ